MNPEQIANALSRLGQQIDDTHLEIGQVDATDRHLGLALDNIRLALGSLFAITTALVAAAAPAAPPRMTTLADFRATGFLDGYQDAPGSPGDRRICQEATCSGCGTLGLRLRAYSRTGSLIGFAVCPSCGTAEEF